MANRSMQAKLIKIKRERRAWARPLSMSGMKTPNRMVLDQYKMSARGLAFDGAITETIAARHIHDAERRLAFQRQAELEVRFDAQLRFKGPGPSNVYEESWVYFNSQQTCFFVVHRDKKLGIERRSITYSCKEILITKWSMGKTTWVELRSIS